jgi:hypothetical protein
MVHHVLNPTFSISVLKCSGTLGKLPGSLGVNHSPVIHSVRFCVLPDRSISSEFSKMFEDCFLLKLALPLANEREGFKKMRWWFY